MPVGTRAPAVPAKGRHGLSAAVVFMIIVNCNNEKNSNHPNHSLAEWDGGCLKESLTRRRGIFLETRGAPQAPDCRGRDGEETNFAP